MLLPRAGAPLPSDLYDLPLTTSADAAADYNRGVQALLSVQRGAFAMIAAAVDRDPGFALGHAALALLGHEYCAPVDLPARVVSARRHAARATDRERSHVHSVLSHLEGDSGPLLRHLDAHPRDALLLSVAIPTIAFAGVTTVPSQAWQVVERCRPAYGSDWWYRGLLAFVRQEQRRFDEAYDLACLSLREEPGAGHSVHARAHVHYETGDHAAGLAWLDGWIASRGASVENCTHFAWHAALHELAQCDLAAVRQRFDSQLAPPAVSGCRAIVDAAPLLWKWALTPGASAVPEADRLLAEAPVQDLETPRTPFMAMHAAISACAAGDTDLLRRLHRWCLGSPDPTLVEVVAPLAAALLLMVEGQASQSADGLARLGASLWRCGGSDAQREVVEDTRIGALLAAGRHDEARRLLDRRLDRRRCRRDEMWRESAARPLRRRPDPSRRH